MESLRKTQRAVERSIMKMIAKDKSRNIAIREETGMKDVGYTTEKLKFNMLDMWWDRKEIDGRKNDKLETLRPKKDKGETAE